MSVTTSTPVGTCATIGTTTLLLLIPSAPTMTTTCGFTPLVYYIQPCNLIEDRGNWVRSLKIKH